MKNKTIRMLMAVLAVALVAGPVFAWGPDKSECGKGSGERREQIRRELNLTPEQDSLLTDARKAHRARMGDIFKALKEKKTALKAELDKPGVTASRVAPIVADIKKLQSELVDSRVDGILQVKSILTPEQYARLGAIKDGKCSPHDRRGRKGW